MDTQDFRSLQEAYMEVVMNEGLGGAKNQRDKERLDNRLRDIENSTENSIQKLKQGKARWQQQRKADQAQEFLEKHPRKKRTQREQVDLYDIILSHLLDEGYAETLEAAEVIMVNMSEDWRESIVEDVLDEAAVDWEMSSSEMEKARNERKFGKQSFNQAGQTTLRRELHKSRRGMKKKDDRRWDGEK